MVLIEGTSEPSGKILNRTSYSKERNFPWAGAGGQGTAGLIRSCSSLTHADASFCFTRDNSKLATVLSKEEREAPQNKWFQHLLGVFHQISLSGPASHHGRWLHGHHPCALQGPATLPWKSQEPKVLEHSNHTLGAPQCSHNHPGTSLLQPVAYSREPGGPRHCQNPAVPLWVTRNCYQNWGLSAHCSKVNKRQVGGKGKFTLFSEADKEGW